MAFVDIAQPQFYIPGPLATGFIFRFSVNTPKAIYRGELFAPIWAAPNYTMAKPVPRAYQPGQPLAPWAGPSAPRTGQTELAFTWSKSSACPLRGSGP